MTTQIDIAKFKRKILKEKIDSFKTTLNEVEPADLYNVVEKWTKDMVHRSFLVEDEDINYSHKELTQEEKEKL